MQFLIFTLLLIISCTDNVPRKLSVSNLFSDGVILQRDTTVAIWGYANPYDLIKIESSWGSISQTKSNGVGKWSARIKTDIAGGPHSIRINSSKEYISINNILFGEIWLAAGQSNMEMNFDYCCNSTDSSSLEIQAANYPELRMFNVKKHLSYNKTDDLHGSWVSAVGSQINDFSAVGYFFAKYLQKELMYLLG